MKGTITKMTTVLASPVEYSLPVGDDLQLMNPLIGKHIRLDYTGKINCVSCGRESSRSFAQGHCYPCFRDLAECDMCIMKPETCHYEAGTCRQPAWGESHCMQTHFVYLANSSGLKVGITRGSQVPTRWIDQGASQALPVYRVSSRYQSGLIEVELKKHISDRTDWRKMLRGEPDSVELAAARDHLATECMKQLDALKQRFGDNAIQFIPDAPLVEISYPVAVYPAKVKTFNMDKQARIEGVLQGIKGQYLIFDGGVLNIRKFTGYNIEFEVR